MPTVNEDWVDIFVNARCEHPFFVHSALNVADMTPEEITYKIIGSAMKVHNTLGNGFQEVIYQRCLAIELRNIHVDFVREKEQTIFYNGEDVGTRRADFIIDGSIMVELKAVIHLEDVHLAQAKNYLVAYDLPVGLLINFGSTILQYKKVFNARYNQPSKPMI